LNNIWNDYSKLYLKFLVSLNHFLHLSNFLS
jgi:hypothetical protein